jgi:hypothetical protein
LGRQLEIEPDYLELTVAVVYLLDQPGVNRDLQTRLSGGKIIESSFYKVLGENVVGRLVLNLAMKEFLTLPSSSMVT